MNKLIAALLAALVILTVANNAVQAQADTETVTIKTSAQCEMCKKRIEKGMSLEKGVKSAVLNLDDHTLTVVYKKGKTSPEALRNALANIGYDADNVPANEKAYKKLPDCCKKNGHHQHDHDHSKHKH
ncbi:MAG: heavy metal-associated domain-containing protein [Cytophagales bacterium]|nr:heavy-metal-associated domain-containing protein [Bernardetiaceae bacterium]MDW8204182.1 heavy metal-associated domain-containing protein [Cytophagales bacterium]